MDNNFYPVENNQAAEPIGVYAAKAFGWMFLGLLTTFFVALLMLTTALPELIFQNIAVYFALCIAELIFVWVMASRLMKMSVGAARLSFFAYSAVNGITLMFIFLVYNLESIVYVFGISALFFGVMALYGLITKADLTAIGRILMFGVLALLVFWVVSIFINLTALQTTVCFIGIAIFLGLTAYDTQKIKANYYSFYGNPDMLAKASIFSALQLYLDFINLFLYLLRLIGRRR